MIMTDIFKHKSVVIKSFGEFNRLKTHEHERNNKSVLLNKVIYNSTVVYDTPVKISVEYVGTDGNLSTLTFDNVYSIDYFPEDKYFEVQTFQNGETMYNQFLKSDVLDVYEFNNQTSNFYSGPRSIKGYLNEIERYYNSMKAAKDFDNYCHYLTLMKNQIEFLSQYIYETDKLEEFKECLDKTGIDNNMCASIINTVELNIMFMVKGMIYSKLNKEKEDLKKWQKLLNMNHGGDSNGQEQHLERPSKK